MAGLDERGVAARANGFEESIVALDPDLFDEMRGIAVGAAVPLPLIVALNCRTEIMLTPVPECTVFAVAPDAANGSVLLGQNWDFFDGLADGALILVVTRNGRTTRTLTEAGIVGKIGCNDAGVGLCLNLLWSDADNGRVGAPLHVLLRHLLDHASGASDVVRALARAKRASSHCITVADLEGTCMSIESTPDDVEAVYPDGGILVHANHFVSPRIHARDRTRELLPDSLVRGLRAGETLRRKGAAITEEDVLVELRGHTGAPTSVCRHIDHRDPPEKRTRTVASIMMRLDIGSMRVAAGLPCERDYVRID
jgi:isopenicillin-N N-acyltransferase-like protein